MPRTASRLNELLAARELLANLTLRELKIRYKRSALGFLWSLLSPLMMMGVFTLVFSVVFRAPIEDFPLFFLAGYLPWQFFNASCLSATGVVIANSGLVTKVAFPRDVLPLAVVGSQLVHFLLALIPLFAVFAVAGYNFVPYLPVLVVGILLLTLLTIGMSMLFAATNTFVRDVGEFLNVFFLLWFYLTPVVYSLELVDARWRWLFNLNPMTSMVIVIRSALYDLRVPSAARMGGAVLSAVVFLALGYSVYGRLSVRFPKEV